jgi:drug/metabolite transporter (DMT)-like permease
MPCRNNFFTVSGVAATRVSPAMISAGIPICMVNPQSEFHKVLGSSLVFAGALAYAGYLVGSGVLIPRFGAVRFTALALMIATSCCFIQYIVRYPVGLLVQLPQEVWGLSAILGFFCTFLPAILLTQGIKRIGASQAALISGISPVITLALGAWLLNEQLTLWQFLGAGLILAGVVFISYKPIE